MGALKSSEMLKKLHFNWAAQCVFFNSIFTCVRKANTKLYKDMHIIYVTQLYYCHRKNQQKYLK